MKDNLIKNLSFTFALEIIKLCQVLNEKKEFVLSRQLLKSGTSIGANIEEAIAAQTRKDFISKMSIASKEARETRYWLRLFQKSNLCGINNTEYLNSIESIIGVLTKIILTTQKNLQK